MNTIRTIGLLFLTGPLEISGACLIWQWIRGTRSAWVGLLGGADLLIYGLTQTLQQFNFGRVFAAFASSCRLVGKPKISLPEAILISSSQT